MTGAPAELVLVRHVQSVANVANASALAGGDATIAVDGPDRDVALSPLGEAQARRLGERIAGWPAMTTAFVSSPYRRCTETPGSRATSPASTRRSSPTNACTNVRSEFWTN